MSQVLRTHALKSVCFASIVGLFAPACETGVMVRLDQDGDGLVAAEDCDDDNPLLPTTFYIDEDRDGWGDASHPLRSREGCPSIEGGDQLFDGDLVYSIHISDCNDQDNRINPETLWYADLDGDGYGSFSVTARRCNPPEQGEWVLRGGDCDDSDASWTPVSFAQQCGDSRLSCQEQFEHLEDSDGDGVIGCNDCDDTVSQIYPGSVEVCNGRDDDCDSRVDEGDMVSNGELVYADADGDGWGDDGQAFLRCTPSLSEGYVSRGGDCDDDDPEIGLPHSVYPDRDQDGFGDLTGGIQVCHSPDGYVENGLDCNDADARFYPGADESCSSPRDYNCDGETGYADTDGDGFAACEECDDSNPDINPIALERCDTEVDFDCDGANGYVDNDGDGWPNCYGTIEPSSGESTCEVSGGAFDLDGDGWPDCPQFDCNDSDPDIHPGAPETVCDVDVDRNCDGIRPDNDIDADGDGVTYCEDCNDNDPSIYPGAPEQCGSVDEDCNPETDRHYGSIDCPAESCLQILESQAPGLLPQDGEYWLQADDGEVAQVACDMSGGGWTVFDAESFCDDVWLSHMGPVGSSASYSPPHVARCDEIDGYRGVYLQPLSNDCQQDVTLRATIKLPTTVKEMSGSFEACGVGIDPQHDDDDPTATWGSRDAGCKGHVMAGTWDNVVKQPGIWGLHWPRNFRCITVSWDPQRIEPASEFHFEIEDQHPDEEVFFRKINLRFR